MSERSASPQGSNADEWAVFLSEHEGPDFRSYVAVQIATAIETLKKKVYVPGQWRCPKCDFRLTQSNLYAATGTVGPRDDPGDKCPNCNGPLWRVSAMEDRNEAFKCANDMFDRVEKLQKRVDRYGLALTMIREGCADPATFAGETLAKENPKGEHV